MCLLFVLYTAIHDNNLIYGVNNEQKKDLKVLNGLSQQG